MNDAREDFIKEANSIRRFKMDELLKWLDTTDFYTAPASQKYHNAQEKGLLLHSLAVLDVARELVNQTGVEVKAHSLTLCCLFHDLCKIGYYKLDTEEATEAQMRKINSLCEEKGKPLIPRSERTKAYVSIAIDALIKGNDLPEYRPNYRIQEDLPLGHGEKSLYLLQRHIQVSEEEALAIRWHIAGFDPGVHFNYPSGSPSKQAFRENPIVAVLACADFTATYLVDDWN